MVVFSNRASSVLYNFLKTNGFRNRFLLPANVCPVVPLTMMKAGVDFEFVDIDDRHTMCEDLALQKMQNGNYAGILFVHSYGKIFNNSGFYKKIKAISPDLCIIDDRCLCRPELDGLKPDNVDLVLYSTGYAKYVELSYGGYGVTDIEIDNYNYPFSEEEENKQQVYIKNCLLNNTQYELPADYPWLDGSELTMEKDQYFGVIRNKISQIDKNKSIINEIYKNNLPKDIQWEGYDNWRFMIEVEKRDEILNAIFNNGLFAGTNFPSVSWMFKGTHSINAEKESKHIINLFNDFRVNEDFAVRICKIINTVINN